MEKSIALVGGGPAALMLYRQLVKSAVGHLKIDIFESTDTVGSGMPYSARGAGVEHVTNVSANELPHFDQSLEEWIKALPQSLLDKFGIDRNDFHEKEVAPRLLFGQYLKAQFESEIKKARAADITTRIHYNTVVDDIDVAGGSTESVRLFTHEKKSKRSEEFSFDYVVICTGHHWPHTHEGEVPGFFDSPYPPEKLNQTFNHAVAVRGSSLTAIDAIRTMSRANGEFVEVDGRLSFIASESSADFRIAMHSRHGLLPCVRVHMEEPHVNDSELIPARDIEANMAENGDFLQLDFLFERGFKLPLKESDPAFYEQIKEMNLETFVDKMMSYRENADAFELLKREYEEARQSIKKERPVYWKEMLAALSFAMNYPAKHLSAEDMLRLQKHLLPLISVVIAFVPQSSCEELFALHDAGRITLTADGGDGETEIAQTGEIIYKYTDNGKVVEERYKTFVNCTGQPHLSIKAIPFKTMIESGQITGARLRFKSQEEGARLFKEHTEHVVDDGGQYYLEVSGAAISDAFQVIDKKDVASEHLYLMAVPYMGGFNPDYSGLDFCEKASELIVDSIV